MNFRRIVANVLMMAKFITSQKGHPKLIIGEFMYTKEDVGKNNKVYWVVFWKQKL